MPEIDVKQAVAAAMAFAREMFPEAVSRGPVTLEEVERDFVDDAWDITLGLNDEAHPFGIAGLGPRKYKVFKVDGSTGSVSSVKIRPSDVAR